MIERLKSEILKDFGEPLVYTKDCKFLADRICERTESRISTTTIRRLYGFLKASGAPGKYTLNILATYLGFKSWEHFCIYWESQPKEEMQPKEEWTEFYNKALGFSTSTYQLISGLSGIPFNAVCPRLGSEIKIDKFLNSSRSALAFVAPGGFGKSCMISKWFERNWIDKKSEDVVIFLNATLMIGYMNSDFKLENWIQDQLKFTQKDSLKYFLNHPESCQSRIIFVLDALDEITYDNFKLEKLFLQIKQFILSFKNSNKFKLIITSRNSTWQKFALPFVVKENALKKCWYDMDEEHERIHEANLPFLTQKEIKAVLDKTLNLQYGSNIGVGDLSFHQKKMISNPFFLELFVKLYSPNNVNRLNEGFVLMQEYIKNKIHYSRYSEEKIDILYAILELMNHGKSGVAAKKYALRDKYPVHLKTAGNYYQAYHELISYGILTEYISNNDKSNLCRFVKITNEVLFESLIAIDLLDKNDGVDFQLIKKVDKEYRGYELKNRLISHLLSSASLSGKNLKLRNLYELSDDTLSDPTVLGTIFNSPFCKEKYKLELAEYLSSNKKSEKLFETSLSSGLHVNDNNKGILKIFAKNSATKNIKIRALSLLLISSIFSFQQDEADQYFNELNGEEADTSCSGFTIAIRLAAILMYNHFIGNDPEIELLKLFYYREMAYLKYSEQNGSVDGEFEMILCMALSYMKSYHKVLQLVDDAEHIYKDDEDRNWSSNYKLLKCYKIFAQQSLGVSTEKEQVDYLLNCKNEINFSENYYFQIYYNSFLTFCYMEDGDIHKVEEFFNHAIEISEFAKYHLCEVSIYSKMAQFYNGINEKTKEQICISEEERLYKKYKPKYNLKVLFV